ncbi:hypothetical protein RND81_02G041700 [Saponaria officinalis]|uniref:Phytocyanin domain-containing protein n=1 Tax=Saponaria officinalis TaxID=3572 RepID=A0AAW1MR54_SAPOF
MASICNKVIISVMLICISLCLMFKNGNSTEFMVGDSKGWGVPPSKEPNSYNLWAEKKRFKVNDTLEFQYKKDSIMIVNEAEYEKCKTSSPLFFSNNGNTAIALNRSGLFYFISGVTGHCERGQKMVVKVLDVTDTTTPQQPPASPADDDHSHDNKKKNGANTRFNFMGFSCMFLVFVGVFVVLV